MAEVTTNFRDKNYGDLGKNLVSREYLISVYPKIASQILPPENWCWGGQAFGQPFGLLTSLVTPGDTTNRFTPIPFLPAGPTGWKQIIPGLALHNNGALFTWGANFAGYLGINNNSLTFNQASSPMREATSSTNWKTIGFSSNNRAAIKSDGTLWSWGIAAHGELGNNFATPSYFLNPNGPTIARSSPVQEATLSTDWKEVYPATFGHTLAIKNNGTLWATGANYLGQLGINSLEARSNFVQVGTSNQWKKICVTSGSTSSPPGPASSAISLGIQKDGSLWGWGSNFYNYLQINGASTVSWTPRQIFTGVSVPTNVTGDNNTFSGNSFISNTGILYTWGANYGGAVGNNTNSNTYVVSPVREATSSTNWKQICGHNSIGGRFFGIKGDGTLWGWGTENSSGSLGLNQALPQIAPGNIFSRSRSSPVRETTLSTNWKQVTMFGNTVLAIKTDGQLWGWGSNSSGQLGVNDTITRSNPIRIGLESSWAQLSSGVSGGTAVFAIKTDGTLWSWGSNNNGQLGVNDTIVRSTPVQEFTSSTNWSFVSHGYQHVAAIKSDGSLWTWGYNLRGQLARNDSAFSRPTPARESTLSTWSHCACGGDNTYAIKTDGTLWSCGSNYVGALGINSNPLTATTTTSQRTFVQEFTSSTNWKMVQFPNPTSSSGLVSGYSALSPIMALKTDGSLWAWGNNHRYQMAYDGRSLLLTPAREGTNSTWKDISIRTTNYGAFLGIKTNGTLWSFSGGSPVTYDGSWVKLSIAGSDTESNHIIKTDGSLWALGGAQFGSAGTNSGTTNTIPTQVFGSKTNWKYVISAGRCVYGTQSIP